MGYELFAGDCLPILRAMPADSVDLVFSSPPYELARLYLEGGKNLGVARKTEDWVEWMVELTHECLRVCTGLVAWVVEGQTRNYRYSGGPMLLAADLIRAGVCMRKPAIYHRIGISGSGGPDWLRNDYEFILCCTRGGKLPYSDNTACGHPPKWAPGGERSHRTINGKRVNHAHDNNEKGDTSAERRAFEEAANAGESAALTPGQKKFASASSRGASGKRKIRGGRRATSGKKNGDTTNADVYEPPEIVNPGNRIEEVYTASQVAAFLDGKHDIVSCKVGGGLMGHPLAHDNEAPFPLKLPTFFVSSFCRPGGKVLDPFCGSGSTGQAAIEAGCEFIGIDLRPSQVELSRRRLSGITPLLKGME